MVEEQGQLEVEVDSVEVGSLSMADVDYLSPDQAMSLAGISGYSTDFANHNHCQYSRCVTKQF